MNWKHSFTLGILAPGEWGGQSWEWEVLFDGVLTTTPQEIFTQRYILNWADFSYNKKEDGNYAFLSLGDEIRMTVDGETRMYVVDNELSFGNLGLIPGSPDDGTDYLVYRIIGSFFISRNPGTYTVKIERRVPVYE
jgi:hypothetical protein